MIDLTGQKFGRWTVLREEGRKGGEAAWFCICDCGETSIIRGGDLRNGKSRSCGCLRIDMGSPHKSHGESNTRLYKIWKGIKGRCYNTNLGRTYQDYGGRGIEMFPEWKDAYEPFAQWAKENGYDDTMSIERIDVNKDYTPENCTFIPIRDQSKNRRNTLLTVNGVTKTKQQWANAIGIDKTTLSSRLNKLGWDPERAVSAPARELHREK